MTEKVQNEILVFESRITAVNSKIKQIENLQMQNNLPASDSLISFDLGAEELSVREKDRVLTPENIRAVEQVAEYDDVIERLEQQKKDLKGRLMQGHQELLEIMLCPITQEVMIDPVLAADNHTYERQDIELWLQNHSRSPMTNQELLHKNLQPNRLVKDLLEKLRQLHSN